MIIIIYFGMHLLQVLSPNSESVGPLFEQYSRLLVILENNIEDDSLHTNLSLLVLIAEKVLIDTCHYTVSHCTGKFETVNHDIASLSTDGQ